MRVLYIEDEVAMGATVAALFAKLGPQHGVEVEIRCVQTLAEADNLLALEAWDAVLLDLTLPDSSAEETLAWLDFRARELPAVIVITGSEKGERRWESLRCGALGFIFKHDMLPHPRHLLLLLTEAAAIKADILKRYGGAHHV